MSDKNQPGPSAVDSSRVERLLLRWLGKDAKVSTAESWSDRFRMIELEGAALQGVAWTAGQKIQIPLVGMRVARTYTPITWDTVRGSTRFLVFKHGSAPGSDWAQTVVSDAICHVIGPRRSIDIATGDAPIMLFGDETALGLAAALRLAEPNRRLDVLLEVGDIQECRPIIEQLDLAHALLVERRADDAHIAAIEAKLAAHANSDAVFVLTGRAPAIQRIHRTLKLKGVKSARLHAKAYWSPGKTGLD